MYSRIRPNYNSTKVRFVYFGFPRRTFPVKGRHDSFLMRGSRAADGNCSIKRAMRSNKPGHRREQPARLKAGNPRKSPLFFNQVADHARFGQKPFHFFVVSLEWVAHDQKIAAVTGNRIPINDVRNLATAGLKKRDGLCSA